MDLTKKISKLEKEIVSLDERINSNDHDVSEKKELIASLEIELKEKRLECALNSSEKLKNEVEDIRGKLSITKNDLEEQSILSEALQAKKSQVLAENEGLKSDRGRGEGLKMVKQLPGLIDRYNSLAEEIICISAKAKLILSEAKDRGCKSEVDGSFWTVINGMVGMVPKAETKGLSPVLASINNHSKRELLTEVLK